MAVTEHRSEKVKVAESESIIVEKGGVKRLGRLPEIAPLVRGRLEAVFAGCFNRADFA